MTIGVLLAKGVADFTFGGAFFWYLVKFLVSIILAFCAILLGIRWRKSKNIKAAAEVTQVEGKTEETEA